MEKCHERALAPSAERITIEGAQVVVLAEPRTSSRVAVALDVGCNIIRFDTRLGGADVQIIAPPPSIETLRKNPCAWGTAVLFPYPGLVEGQEFSYRGRRVRIWGPGKNGATVHGIVRALPWSLDSTHANEATGASLTARLDSGLSGISPRQWPFGFSLRLDVRLWQRTLRIDAEVTNTAVDPMPFGLGFHPYIPLPLGPLGRFDSCKVYVAATEGLEQTSSATPRGKSTTIRASDLIYKRPAIKDIELNLATPRGPVRNYLFRQSRRPRRRGIRAGIYDPLNRVSVNLSSTSDFSTLVLFTPPERSVVSLEPLTCVPNGLNWNDLDGLSPGVLELLPGQRWRGSLALSAREWRERVQAAV